MAKINNFIFEEEGWESVIKAPTTKREIAAPSCGAVKWSTNIGEGRLVFRVPNKVFSYLSPEKLVYLGATVATEAARAFRLPQFKMREDKEFLYLIFQETPCSPR